MLPRTRFPFALLFLAGCADLPFEPPATPAAPAPAPPAATVEATLGIDASGDPGLPPGAPASLRPSDPSSTALAAAFRSAPVMRALADELGQPVTLEDAPHPPDGIVGSVHEEAGHARIVVGAPHPAAAMAACRAWARIAGEQVVRADPVEAWLVGETARIERDLAALDRELATLPPITPTAARSRDEVLLTARVRRLEAEAKSAARGRDVESALGPADSPILDALKRMLQEARRGEREGRVRGRGPRHPDVRALADRARWLEARIAAQWQNEIAAARGIEDAMTALPKKADRAAVGKAIGARLRRVDAAHVSSLDPVSLQILAVQAMLLAAEDAELAVRYGPAHPDRVAQKARIEALDASFAIERDGMASVAEHEFPFVEHDPRPDRIREDTAQLGVTLARLARYRETVQRARLRAIAPCHAR